MDQFRKEVTDPFSYQEVNKPRQPMIVSQLDVSLFRHFGMGYINYYMPNLSDARFTLLPEELKSFINLCVKILDANKIPYDGRRFHLTLDNSPVLPGDAHREKRWHIDSPHGKKSSIIFLACDSLPTEFLTNPPVLNWPARNSHQWQKMSN